MEYGIKMKLAAVIWVILLISSGSVRAADKTGRKIIQCGWDQRRPEQLAGIYQDMEKRLPFDGLILSFTARDASGKKIGSSERLWQRGKWADTVFDRDIELMKQCRFTKFKHNFILTGATGNRSEPADWFDDEFWADVASNMRLAARAAFRSGCRGLVFDAETYSKFRWAYRPDSGKSYQKTAEQARKRGRQIMKAVKSEYPDATILFYWFLSMSGLSSPDTFPKIGYGLYPAFINGLLDELPPDMTLVDGCENGYWYKNKASFLNSYQKIRSASNPAVAPENRKKFRRQVLAGFGIYLDSHIIRSGYSVPPVNGSQLRAFRYQLTNALDSADEYVWLYGERRTWYSDEESRSWETTFPGVVRAIELSRNPAGILDELPAAVSAGKLKNLARNPEFEDGQSSKTEKNDLGFTSSRIPGFAQFGKGKAAVDKNTGSDSPTSVVMLGGSVTLIQTLNVKEGQSYYVRIKARSEGQGEPRLSIGWQTAQATWCGQDCGKNAFATGGSSTNWQAISAFTQVPAGAGKLVVMLSSRNRPVSERVWFDKLEIFQLDDLYEEPDTYQAMMREIRRQNKARNGEFRNGASDGLVKPVKTFPSFWVWNEKQPGPGVYSIDGTTGFRSSQAAKVAGMDKKASICQYIPVNPGEKYRISVYGKMRGNGKFSLSV
ncbi:MAG: hypothetical protein IKO93_18170, partial [Lentisphaeria bacterium]|nr:hypothetical protein [Lentisphaeria bacterium]